MEDADAGLRAQAFAHAQIDSLQIAGEQGVVVPVATGARIVAVIAEVEHDELEAVPQRPPERQISIDGEAIAVADEEPHAIGFAVLADANRGAVIHDQLEALERGRRR